MIDKFFYGLDGGRKDDRKIVSRGIHPPTFKDLTAQKPIKKFPSQIKCIFPSSTHWNSTATISEKRRSGQKRSENCRCRCLCYRASSFPIAGKVLGIEECPHPTRGKFGAIVIENSGSQEDEINGILFQEEIERMDPKSIQNWIREGGFVGLGGAAFPTHVKVSPPSGKKIDTLIINGAECEPFITVITGS